MSETRPNMFADPASYPDGQELLTQLVRSLEKSRHLANFACGGSIPIVTDESWEDPNKFPRPASPVVIRWDQAATNGGDAVPSALVKKVVFSDSFDDSAVAALIASCQPATFGRGQTDVLDESYRKAGKLDPTQFSTNFCPYETGIVDAVGTVLLNEATEKTQFSFGVWAELYKLNVYSGPSGKFKAHVDTPRSDKQFGSLVVCLPYPHTGGTLQVRHDGRVKDFDWSVNSSSSRQIQWAAFYSDCEHEVLEVQSGHRITLTYNLYHKSVPALSPPVSFPLDAKQIPFYDVMKKLLQLPEFMKGGGLLGINCSHSYPHAHPLQYDKIPHMLKGADAAIYRSLMELSGVSFQLLPVVHADEKGELDHMFKEMKKALSDKDKLTQQPRHDGSFEALEQQLFPQEPEEAVESDEERSSRTSSPVLENPHITYAGTKLQPLRDEEVYPSELLQWLEEDFERSFPMQVMSDVQWLKERHWPELSMFYVAYGNQASSGYVYSYLSFIVDVAPYSERAQESLGDEEAVTPA